jgi:hypothetical protein
MVLGVQWLESLGPVLWVFCRNTISFVRDGHWVLWWAVHTSPTPALLAATTEDVMDELLQQYGTLFATPTGLPPARQRSHRIRLLLVR